MQTQSSQECSTGTRGSGIPSPLLYWYPAHKDLCRSSSPDMPSIHPLVRLWQTQHHQHTRAAVRLTLFLRQSLSKCPRAPLCPGVQHQLNLSSRQSEEHWSHPISLHYETELVLCCHIAVVLQGRCCLIHHQGTKGLAGGGGGGGGAFLFLRHSYSLLLELHKHLGEVSH